MLFTLSWLVSIAAVVCGFYVVPELIYCIKIGPTDYGDVGSGV